MSSYVSEAQEMTRRYAVAEYDERAARQVRHRHHQGRAGHLPGARRHRLADGLRRVADRLDQ